MKIKVAIALSNYILAEGVRKFFDHEEDIEVVDVPRVGAKYDQRLKSKRPDVVLVDFLTLYNGFHSSGTDEKARFILFDTTCGEDNITSAVLSKGLSGVLPFNAAASSLTKAVRSVAAGELWIGRKLDKDTCCRDHASL